MHSTEGLIGLADLTTYLRMFSILINSGVSLVRGLHILGDSITFEPLRQANAQVVADIEGGQTLSAAMRKHPQVFSPFLISLVRAGEIGGVLDDVLERAADFYRKQLEYRRQRFVYLATARVLGTEHEDRYSEVVRELEELLLLQYFLYMFGTMLGSGVPILMSLDVAAEIMPELGPHDAQGGHESLRTGLAETLLQAKRDIRDQKALSPRFAAAGLPTGVVTLIAIGEDTGTLDRTAIRAGDLLEAEIEGRMQKALGLNDF